MSNRFVLFNDVKCDKTDSANIWGCLRSKKINK